MLRTIAHSVTDKSLILPFCTSWVFRHPCSVLTKDSVPLCTSRVFMQAHILLTMDFKTMDSPVLYAVGIQPAPILLTKDSPVLYIVVIQAPILLTKDSPVQVYIVGIQAPILLRHGCKQTHDVLNDLLASLH